jgi:hypothetical protein
MLTFNVPLESFVVFAGELVGETQKRLLLQSRVRGVKEADGRNYKKEVAFGVELRGVKLGHLEGEESMRLVLQL